MLLLKSEPLFHPVVILAFLAVHSVSDGQVAGVFKTVLKSAPRAVLKAVALSEAESSGKNVTSLCPDSCGAGWSGDGWCDTACFLESCNWDDGDCQGWCAPDCKAEWKGDGHCDFDCFREECNWDGGDCPNLKLGSVVFPPTDPKTFDYSGCQSPCKYKISNGQCDTECNTIDCNFDGHDCIHRCAAGCANAWLGDGECDQGCNMESCDYDKGDCKECSAGCTMDLVGNGLCDGPCMTEDCHWDAGDCAGLCKTYLFNYEEAPFLYPHCRDEWQGDGSCDCWCYNSECNWDKGDCKTKEDREACSAMVAAVEEMGRQKFNKSGGAYPPHVEVLSDEDFLASVVSAESTAAAS